VLHLTTLIERDGLQIRDVECRHGAGAGEPELYHGRHTLVFVRRGCFVRHADGVEAVLDPTLAYCLAPGQELRYDHPDDAGDRCTAVTLDDPLLASIWGGEPGLPAGPLAAPVGLDLAHRRLLAAARRGEDEHAVVEAAIALAAATLAQQAPARVASGRPSTVRARRRLVADVRMALACDHELSLTELARRLAVSPHHLSRVFRSATGETIAAHRVRLRLRRALERLADGERDLARLALDTGFTDHSHLCRVARAQTAETPSALRAQLGL
jgi:AraC-like DNA-binding protein